MSLTPSTAAELLDAAIARAERRRAMLERLAEIGMALAQEIGERTVHAPLHPEPRHDPCQGFAAVSRAVRLTLALEARVEAEIFALRNGEMPAVVQRSSVAMSATARATSEEEPGDNAPETDPRDRTCESLIEREDDDALLALPFADCVEAIRADLGLRPDESARSDGDEDASPDLPPSRFPDEGRGPDLSSSRQSPNRTPPPPGQQKGLSPDLRRGRREVRIDGP